MVDSNNNRHFGFYYITLEYVNMLRKNSFHRERKFNLIFNKLLAGASFGYKSTDHFSFKELIRLCIESLPEEHKQYNDWEKFCRTASDECAIKIKLCTFHEFVTELRDKKQELSSLANFLASSLYHVNSDTRINGGSNLVKFRS